MPTAWGAPHGAGMGRRWLQDAHAPWEVPGLDWSPAGRKKFSRGLESGGSARAAHLSICIQWFLLDKATCLRRRHCCCFTGLEVAVTIGSVSFSGESRLPSLKNLKG